VEHDDGRIVPAARHVHRELYTFTTGKANRHDLAFLGDNAAGRGLQVPLGEISTHAVRLATGFQRHASGHRLILLLVGAHAPARQCYLTGSTYSRSRPVPS
jgi:hypothetical protein